MRIITFFLTTLLGLIFLGGVLFLLGREVMLVIGSSMVKADYKQLQRSYSHECVGQYDYAQESFTQLRFISGKEYNLEVVCADFTANPIILEQKKLPPLLFKTSTGSGFILDQRDLPYWIKLSVLGRDLFVYTEQGQMHSSYLMPPELDYELGPLSSCQAHTYQCCNLDVQSGVGDQLTGVNDCPKSCYTSCSLKPVVLSFNSRPALDLETRIIEARAGEPITFSYVIGNGKADVFAGQLSQESDLNFLERAQTIFGNVSSDTDGNDLVLPITVTLDFGDGNTWQSNSLQDTTDHSYVCPNRTCFFQVKLSALDGRGVLSVENELTKMVVRVDR